MLVKLLEKNFKRYNYFYYYFPFILGLCTSFSLPPYSYTFINFITFTCLSVLLLSAKRAECGNRSFFLIGWFFGLGFFISGLYWISISLTHDNSFKILIPFALVIIPSFLAIFYGVATLILKRFVSPKVSFILIFSLVFAIIEYLRGNILSGFPWNLIAYSWSWSREAIQFVSLIGTYGFNLLSITIFSFPFIFFIKVERIYKIKAFIILFIIIGVIFSFGVRVSKNKIYTDINDFSIKIVSPNIELNEFFKNGNDNQTIKKLIKLSDPDKEQKTIFVWPEGMFSSTYLNEINKYKEIFYENFSDNHLIIFGINKLEYKDNKEHIYNSLVVADNNLNLLASYNKNKLVPFGEFLPYEDFFYKIGLKKITYGYRSFSKGGNRTIINIKNNKYNFNFLPLICYEIIYSGKLKDKKQKFNLIVNISEDGWFGNSIGPYQHFTHAVYRAIEEGVYVVRSTNNGISAFISPYGEIVNSLKSNEKGVIEVKISKYEKNTIFSKHGNIIFFLIIMLYILLILILKKTKSSNE